jgi:hypothetical protein
MDFRFHRQLDAFIKAENLDSDGVDIVRLAGVAKNLVRPDEPADRQVLLKQVRTSAKLHGIQEVYLVNHEDCGAYGLENVPDSDEELNIHASDLREARDLLRAELPGLDIKTYFLRMDGRAEPVA